MSEPATGAKRRDGSVFDASQFHKTLQAAIGSDRDSTAVKLRNSSRANNLVSALEAFTDHVNNFISEGEQPNFLRSNSKGKSDRRDSDPEDVVAAYLHIRPDADELFHALRAVQFAPLVTLAALKALTAISRYARFTNGKRYFRNPETSIRVAGDDLVDVSDVSASRVLQHVVMSRVALIYDVIASGRSDCIRFALYLLTNVAEYHPLFAKEIVGRFDLTSTHFAPALCKPWNHRCRLPFIALITSLINVEDNDISVHLYTDARDALIACLSVTRSRLRAELAHGIELSRQRKSGETKNLADIVSNHKGKGKDSSGFQIFPSNVQTRELEGVITFLNSIKRWIARTISPQLSRALCASFFIDLLVHIAVAPIPPLTVVPRNVTEHHIELRTAAKVLLISLLSSSSSSSSTSSLSASRVAAALARTNAARGEPEALNVLTSVVSAHPAVGHLVLASGMLLKLRPELSSRWMGIASGIAHCLQVSATPVEMFLKREFFGACFSHESALVRHWGSLIALALTRSVMKDPKAMEISFQYLPELKAVYKTALAASPSDTVAQELFTTYQFFFDTAPDVSRIDMVQAALKISDNDFCGAEGAIRFLLVKDPHLLVHKLIENKQLSELFIQAASATKVSERTRMWRLSADVIRHIDLFPQGTYFEIDLYLAALSSIRKDDLAICAKEFESVLHSTLDMAYKVFDELYDVHSGQPNPFPRASLVVVGLCWKLRELLLSTTEKQASDSPVVNFLRDLLLFIFACDEVKSGHVFKSSYLAHALPRILDKKDFPWVCTENLVSKTPARLEVCRYVCQLCEKYMRHAQTSFLKLVQRSAIFREFLISEKEVDIRSWQVGVHLGLVWDSALVVSDQQPPYNPKADPGVVLYSGTLRERCVNWCDFGAFLLEAKSIYLPGQSVEDGFSELREQLAPAEFLFDISAILRTTDNRNVRIAALRIVTELLPRCQGDPNQSQICSFARSSIVSILQNQDNLSLQDVSMILNYSTDTLSGLRYVKQPCLEVLLFCMQVIHAAVFHPVHTVCVLSRRLSQNKLLYSIPPLFSFPSICILQLRELYTFSPHVAKLVDDQLLALSCEEYSHFGFRFLPLLDAILLNAERKGELHNSSKWRDFCKKLLWAKKADSIREAELEGIAFDDRFPTFFRLVAEWDLLSRGNLNQELKCLLDEYPSAHETKAVRIFSWIVLARMCRKGLNGLNFTESLEELQTTLSHFSSILCDVDLSHHDSLFTLVLLVFHAYLRQVVFEDCLKHGTCLERIEKSLHMLCQNLVCKICSWMSKDFESIRTGLHHGDHAWDSRSFELILRCLTLLISARAVEESDLGKALSSLKENYFRYMFKYRSNERESSTEFMSTSIITTICGLLRAAINFYGDSCNNPELAHVFASAQGLLSLERVRFSAKASERDICISRCQHAIDSYLTRSSALTKFSMSRRGQGFFYQQASAVLQNFDKESLESARMDVFAWSYQSRGSSPTSVQNLKERAMYDRSQLTDSEFLLRLFFAACREALDSPESPMLDLGRIAKGGLLAVAITALSAPNEGVRTLGFACIQLFSEVVGPMSNVGRGSAAGLYKDRRQLSYLLQLLQNSIGNAIVQILPLFAAWFNSALGVALSPIYPCYKQVTHFLLRSAYLDTSDCVGIYNLLNCEGDTETVHSGLSLALEALEWGVQTATDMVVVRKRKMIESLMFLASSGDESRSLVREKAFVTISTLVGRDPCLRLIPELHHIYGIAGWLGCEGLGLGAISEKECIARLDLLSNIANHINGDVAFMEEASKSISLLLSRVENQEDSERMPPKVASRTIVCAENVARVEPLQLSVFATDFANLWHRAGAKFENDYCFEGITLQRALFVVLRQVVVGEIRDEIVDAVLMERIRLLERRECVGNREEYPFEILAIDAFISRVLVFRMERQERSTRISDPTLTVSVATGLAKQNHKAPMEKAQAIASQRTCGLLARSLERCATIWLTIAALCAVTSHGKSDEKLRTLAGHVPAWPPDNVSISCTRSYAHGVQTLQNPLIDSLLQVVTQ